MTIYSTHNSKSTSIIIIIKENNYAFKNLNPVDCVKFYDNKKDEIAISIQKDKISLILPEKFSEKFMRIIARNNNVDHDEIKKMLEEFNSLYSH